MVIVQYGGQAFSTAALTLEQWTWCTFFGVGTLVWGQLVTTIPTRKIPKIFSWGRGNPEDMAATMALVEDKYDENGHEKKRSTGQILWIRGLTRLQTQIRVVNAFRQGVDTRSLERTNPALAAVLQRQATASMAKRLSQASSIDYADAPGATGLGERDREGLAPEMDMERLSSRSHTETAV